LRSINRGGLCIATADTYDMAVDLASKLFDVE
jgi:hypothetical protein